MTISSKLLLERSHQGEVAHLILNSPQNLNAMDLEMAEAFRECRASLASDKDCRAVVVRGEGRSFSAGGDLEMLRQKASKSVTQNRQDMMEFYQSFLGLRMLNMPLICALHGHVVGAGFCFAAACDLRVADESILLSAPFTRLALHPGMGGSYFLPRAFGSEVARDLMLTGRRMGSDEAYRRGFVSSVSVQGKVSDGLEQVLQAVLKAAPGATRALLATEREQESSNLEQALAREAYEQAVCYSRAEFLQGVEALIEKRNPPWMPLPGKGRNAGGAHETA